MYYDVFIFQSYHKINDAGPGTIPRFLSYFYKLVHIYISDRQKNKKISETEGRGTNGFKGFNVVDLTQT